MIMKVKYLAIIASFLSIAPFIYIHQTVGQNSTNSKEQKAIEIASKKLKVPANELRVVATADIEGVTRFKVSLNLRFPMTNITMRNQFK